jgi:non-heme chloroperoxidase
VRRKSRICAFSLHINHTGGAQLYYKDWGSGQPVVFSHGWPLNADAWEDQMVFLAADTARNV